MLGRTKIESFTYDLENLETADGMFLYCTSLTKFSGKLSSLKTNYYMFSECINLTSFDSDLSSLIGGVSMFSGCKLDGTSVRNILTSIPTYNDNSPGNHRLDLGINSTDGKQQFE